MMRKTVNLIVMINLLSASLLSKICKGFKIGTLHLVSAEKTAKVRLFSEFTIITKASL